MTEAPDADTRPPATPLVTIVIPTFNGERFVGKAIASCLAQSHPAIEVLIVDDGSTDDSASIALGFVERHPHVHLLTHEENQGVSAAWNSGLEAARGEFVLRLAQDDRLEPECVASMIQSANDNPRADVLYADETRIDQQNERCLRRTSPPELLFQDGNNIGLCVMIHRRILDQGFRYDPGVRAAEDLDFFVRLYDHGFQFIHHEGPPLLLVQLHAKSSSANHYAQQQIEVATILAPRKKRLTDRWAMYGRYHSMAVYHLRQQGNAIAAAKLSLTGLARSPFCRNLWRQLFAIAIGRKPRP